MDRFITIIRDWSEVWALLIPLAVILVHKGRIQGMRAIRIYVVIALILNIGATTMYIFHKSIPPPYNNNNILYNLHSVAKVVFFSWYITQIRYKRFAGFYKLLFAAYLLFVLMNFVIMKPPEESLFKFSSRLTTVESVLLLLVCLSFFIPSITEDSETNWLRHPAFLVCTGVCLYEAINFFIFLFFYPLNEQNPVFGKMTMTIHHIVFALLCCMLAIALYRSTREPARQPEGIPG